MACAEVLYTEIISLIVTHPRIKCFAETPALNTLTLDKEDYLPKTSAQIEFTFGTFVSVLGTDAWIILQIPLTPKRFGGRCCA